MHDKEYAGEDSQPFPDSEALSNNPEPCPTTQNKENITWAGNLVAFRDVYYKKWPGNKVAWQKEWIKAWAIDHLDKDGTKTEAHLNN